MKLKDKPTHNVIIPSNIRYSDKISEGAKLLYAEIFTLSNEHGQFVPYNKIAAKWYGVSEVTMKRRFKELKDNNLVNEKGEII